MTAGRIGLAVLLVGMLTVTLRASSGQEQSSQGPDSVIQAQVERQLGRKNINDLTVTVKDGVVTLSGQVTSLWTKNQAVEIARKTADVKSVVSQLTIERAESDRDIGEQIASQVRRYPYYTVFDDVNAFVKDGVVTLTGAVTEPRKASDIADMASRVTGVQEVKNEFVVLSVSSTDARLRIAIADQIFNDPMFTQYAIQSVPPIHIIVQGGKVTLVGVVSTQMERMKAEMIARSTFGVFSVENKLRVEQ
jgi:hyperosmotically inducible periplasmic protein